MDIQVAVTGTDLQDERIAEATRELLKDIRADADPRARLVTAPAEPGTKGVAVSLGEIALSLVTGGAIGKFIEALFGFLGRNRRMSLKVQNQKGESLELSLEFVNRHGLEKAMALADEFLSGGK
jgi:hypothetical protein